MPQVPGSEWLTKVGGGEKGWVGECVGRGRFPTSPIPHSLSSSLSDSHPFPHSHPNFILPPRKQSPFL